MDTISKQKRSMLMSRIRSKDTGPEKITRALLHKMGYRFRLHRNDLPGKPDIVLPRHAKIIFVQGCFWHGHDCAIAGPPRSNQAYWQPKIKRNQERDKAAISELERSGWTVLELWECKTRKPEELEVILSDFFREDSRPTPGKRRCRT